MRALTWIVIAALLGTAGCAGRKSSLLLERQARGPLNAGQGVATPAPLVLVPDSQTQKKDNVEVTLTHANAEYLNQFFSNERIFGSNAGKIPYFPEHLVFYVRISNMSEHKVRINPTEFVMVDSRGNQYSTVGTDYVTAFAEYKHGVATTTRGMLENTSPGYFGFSFPIGKVVAAKPQWRFALLQQSALQIGYLYPGVTHDGLIAFWNPATGTDRLLVVLANIKTAFDPNDLPTASADFNFEFKTAKP